MHADAKHVQGFKSDSHARRLWGAAYDDIPKSVFATVAWHLANLCSESADVPGAAEARAVQEIETLGYGHIPERQAKAAVKAIRAAISKAEGK